MNVFGLGPGELILVFVLALIVFGPGKLPEIGAGIGRTLREFRKVTSEMTEGLSRELQVDLAPQEPRRTARPALEKPRSGAPEASSVEVREEAVASPEKPEVVASIADAVEEVSPAAEKPEAVAGIEDTAEEVPPAAERSEAAAGSADTAEEVPPTLEKPQGGEG